MVGDESRARQLLFQMQERLARDPYEALGVYPSSPPADVRNAFLALTKTYHPARFGRLAVDVQKLANEVFLALRAAHDQLSRTSSTASTRRSGPIQIPTSRMPTPSGSGGIPAQSVMRQPSAPHAGAPTQPPPARPPTAPLVTRTAAPKFVSPAAAITRPFGSSAPGTTPPESRPARTPIAGTTGPAVSRTSTGAGPAVSRTSTSPLSQQPRTPAATPPSNPRVTPPTGGPNVAGRSPTLDRELAPILELMTQGQFAAARVALETLVARSPDVVRYRALIAYAKGRDAQLARRIDEARVELQQALQIDPGLELAKTALAELFTRRK